MVTPQKRVLYVAPTYFPHIDRTHTLSILKMVQSMMREGYAVRLLTLGSVSFTSEKDTIEQYGLKSDIDISIPLKKRVSSPEFLNRIENLFLRYRFGQAVKDETERFNPDYIYCRSSGSAYLSFRKLNKKTSPPISLEMHGPASLGRGIIAQKLFLKFLQENNVAKILPTSDGARDYIRLRLKDDLPERINISVESSYLSSDQLEPVEKNIIDEFREKSLKGNFNINIGYTGKLYISGLSGTHIILELAEKFPEIGFHLVGGIDEEVKYWKKKTDTDNVFFYGFRPHAEMTYFLRVFDIVLNPLQPKESDAEGFLRGTSPLKIPEYMAHAKAMIVSDLYGHRDYLYDKRNCLKADPKSLDSWIGKIKLLINDVDLREELEANAHKTYLELLTPARRIERAFKDV